MPYSIYIEGSDKLASVGLDGKPYDDEGDAKANAEERNRRAQKLGVQARYTVGPGKYSKK